MNLEKGRPADCTGRLEKEIRCYDMLDKLGVEYFRVDHYPANTIEVLIVAIARQVILTHDNPWSNLASVLCIAGLFATRRFLIPRSAMKIELSEVEEPAEEETVHN